MKNSEFGFSLAEVLITLGIIGVVAALTMPSLIQSYKERETVARVKKFYSMINQAFLLAINENGPVDEWDFAEVDQETGINTSNKFFEYLRPYLKIAKDCGTQSGCISDATYVRLNGEAQMAYGTNKAYYKVILIDGSYMWMRQVYGTGFHCNVFDGGYENSCGGMWIDVNGKQPPNTIGKDTFSFAILKDRIMPVKNEDCALGKDGWGCSAYILSNGNMNYLKNK